MAEITNAMGPEGKVALNNECEIARTKIAEFQSAVNGIITQIEGVINGLKADYTGDGSVKFYDACDSNIVQMRNLVDNVCKAYGGEEGLFKSIESQILTAEESLNKTLENTNTRFVAKSE